MTDKRVPPPPDTPPRGGATYTLGHARSGEPRTMVDLGSLVERMSDKTQEMYADWPAVKAAVAELPEMKTMLKLALAPTNTPLYVKMSAPAAAFALVVIAIALSLLLARPAVADPPSVRAQVTSR